MAKEKKKEELKQLERARRDEQMEILVQRINVQITRPDIEVWHMLAKESGDFVADYLGVTMLTLNNWMEEPHRLVEYQAMWRARGNMGALAVKEIGADETIDPQSRAINSRNRQWEAEKMNRKLFGSQPVEADSDKPGIITITGGLPD